MKLKNWLLLASLFSLSSYAQNVQGDMNGDNCITMDDVTLLVDRYVTGNTNAQNACVDLGLSVMWASCNIGASKPEQAGTLFAWGETATKSSFEVSNYFDTKDSGRTFKKYNEQGPYTLADEDDAAYVATDGALRMPTQEEWKELYDHCSISYKVISGVRCYKFTGPNRNYIILPYVSDMDGTSPGSVAFAYWSASLDPSKFRCGMMFNGAICSSQSRILGASVRGVKDVAKPVMISSINIPDGDLILEKGNKIALNGYYTPISATRTAITWKSSDKRVAKVVDGMVTAVGLGSCTITATADEGGAADTCGVHVCEWQQHNGHDYVDLGTSVRWATMNIGASSPEGYGYYFAWGGKRQQSVYDWAHCPYQNVNTNKEDDVKFTKYLGSTSSSFKEISVSDENALKIVLDPEDDAARVWGGSWRTPTSEEVKELISNCYWEWVDIYNGKDVSGYVVYRAKAEEDKGKFSINAPSLVGTYSLGDPHIFLPAAGDYWSEYLHDLSTACFYQTSTLLPLIPIYVSTLVAGKNDITCGGLQRYVGRTVRAVF